jgi:2-polyprenyl-3-methyl-5-hydroxy-6-metoxy-1,4-benzoquinol methylase
MIRVRPEDWTSDVIGHFWDYTSRKSHREQLYFSRMVGDGLALLLDLQGVLKGSLLDFGCGPGFLFDHLARYRIECWGVDRSPQSVQKANERCKGMPGFRGAYLADAADGPIAGRTFDVVTCVETIEHVPPSMMATLFNELRERLKPGGTLVLTTPHNERLEESMIYCPFCDREFHQMQHVQSFTEESLAALIQENGFDVTYCRGIDLQVCCDEVREEPYQRSVLSRLRRMLGQRLRRQEAPEKRLARMTTPGPHLIALAASRP